MHTWILLDVEYVPLLLTPYFISCTNVSCTLHVVQFSVLWLSETKALLQVLKYHIIGVGIEIGVSFIKGLCSHFRACLPPIFTGIRNQDQFKICQNSDWSTELIPSWWKNSFIPEQLPDSLCYIQECTELCSIIPGILLTF